jgi:hypothetical protein
MREWHVKHMEKTIVKFVTGLSENASMWEKRQNKRYGRITNICRQIDYDIRQGVTTEQVLMILQKIRDDSSFSTLREKDGSIERLDEVEKYFVTTSNRRNYR